MSAETPMQVSLGVYAFLNSKESNLDAQIHGYLGFTTVKHIENNVLLLVFFVIQLSVF